MKITAKGLLSALSFLIGVVGIVLSVYFYSAQKRFKALSFIVDPKRTLIVSPQHFPSSRLTLLDQAGKKVEKDVYFIEFYLWNSGTETILGQDVIVPLSIRIPSNVRLLDIQPAVVSRPKVTQAGAIPKKQDGSDEIAFSFRVLEPSEGLRLSLLYEGDKDAQFLLNGAITGIRDLWNTEKIAYDQRWIGTWKGYAKFLTFAVAFLVSMGAVPLIEYVWPKVSKKWFPRHAERIGDMFVLVFSGLLALALLILVGYAVVTPLIHGEKTIQENIKDYVPPALKAN